MSAGAAGSDRSSGPPDVSVIIPTRNRWELLLSAALPAALAQDGVRLEVVVVDDGSDEPAPSATVLDDPRVRLLRVARSGGVAAARNAGIRDARGAWIAFLDDDDVWSPRKLRAQLDVLGTGAAQFAYCAAVLVDVRSGDTLPLRLPPTGELATWLRSSSAIPAGASNVLASADLVRRLDGFDERFHHLADWDLWLRLSDAADAAVCRDVLVAERLHGGNMRTAATRTVWREFRWLRAKRRAARSGDELDAKAVLGWIAAQHARSGRRASAAAWYVRAAVARRSPALLGEAARALGGRGRRQSGRRTERPDWVGGGG
jgi:glycosyltransferase involved in cell wall biosynthesis